MAAPPPPPTMDPFSTQGPGPGMGSHVTGYPHGHQAPPGGLKVDTYHPSLL